MPRSLAHQKKVNDRNNQQELLNSITKSIIQENCINNVEKNYQIAVSQCERNFDTGNLLGIKPIAELVSINNHCLEEAGQLQLLQIAEC